MGNEYEKEKISQVNAEDIKIEDNPYLGQDEGDFEEAFKETFKKKELGKEEHEEHEEHEECRDMNHEVYYLQSNTFIQKEEPQHLCLQNYFLKSLNKIDLNENIIDENNEKNNFNIIEQKPLDWEKNSLNQQKIEIDINNNLDENEEEEEGVINDKRKNYETSNILPETERPNPNLFRVYSSNDFNIFHPGGNVEFYKQIKEEINDQLIEIQEDDKKKLCNKNKFKIYKEKNKRTKKKNKEKKKRKEKPDDVRKKIKSRFFKATKNRINQMLKSAKSEEFFDFLPQSFICNISKQRNKGIIDMTFKEIMSQNFGEDDIQMDNDKNKMLQKKRMPDRKKYENNVKVLKYLEKNDDICKKSNFNVVGNMTFREIFNEYLKSEEFEKEIEKLKIEDNSDKYIKDYMIKAFSFIIYFSSSN
jgi:hypothetical protein